MCRPIDAAVSARVSAVTCVVVGSGDGGSGGSGGAASSVETVVDSDTVTSVAAVRSLSTKPWLERLFAMTAMAEVWQSSAIVRETEMGIHVESVVGGSGEGM